MISVADRAARVLRFASLTLAIAALEVIAGCGDSSDGTEVTLPGGESGIGFDDLRYSSALHRVLAPGGGTGKLYLVDPDSMAVETIDGFGKTPDYSGGHDDGPTSVDEAHGRLFVTDRTTRKLSILDAASRTVVGSVNLGAAPDYVRWAEASGEIWVTEPGMDRLAIYRLPDAAPFNPALVTSIPIDNGPESLVLDASGAR